MKDELVNEIVKFLNSNTFFDYETNSQLYQVKLEKKNYNLELSNLKKLFTNAYLSLDCNDFNEILTKVHYVVSNVVSSITKELPTNNIDDSTQSKSVEDIEQSFNDLDLNPNDFIDREDFIIGLLNLLGEFEELNDKANQNNNSIESNISLKQQMLLFQVLGLLDILKDVEATKKAAILSFLTGKSEDNIRQTFSNYYNKENRLCPFRNPDDLTVVIELLESLQLNDFANKAKQLSL